jgi:TPR repeat protein
MKSRITEASPFGLLTPLLVCLVVVSCSPVPASDDNAAPSRELTADEIGALKAAALAGDSEAESDLAFAHEEGRGIPIDRTAAIEGHRKAAHQGVLASQAALGRILLNGIGTPKQPFRGLGWLRKAALAGEPNAQALLGVTFLHGIGRSLLLPDVEKAQKWLLAASEQGNPQANYDLATLYFQNDMDRERGMVFLRKAVDQAQPQAHTLLARLHAEGRGVRLDEAESIRLLRRAAELGDPAGQNEYAVALREGLRVERDLAQSFHWFQKAAWSGLIDAQFNLGLAYVRGTGVEEDRVRGVAWLEVCRDATYRAAIRALGTARDGLTPAQLDAAEELHRAFVARLGE